MAQRKAKKPKRKAAKARTQRTAPRRKPARKAPRRATASRSAGDSRRIAELEAENQRLREELERLRAERDEPERSASAEPEEGPAEGEPY
jgi:hypothetical protein